MAKKRKCSSVASTPQRANLKKAKVDQANSSTNNTSKRRSTRSATKNTVEYDDDAISDGSETSQIEQVTNKSAPKKKTAVLNGKSKSDDNLVNDQSNGLSEESENEEQSTKNSKKTNKKKVLKKEVNNEVKLVNGSKGSSKDQTEDSSFESNQKESKNSNDPYSSNDISRSGRKRKTRFSFKELVGSEDEDDDNSLFGDDMNVDKKPATKSKRPSKKEMKQKVKEFIGDSTDEDDYKPNESEQSDEEEILDVDEEISDDEGRDSDVSDVLPSEPKKSRYFNKTNNGKKKPSNANRSRVNQSVRNSSISKIDLSKYKAPKSGGCTFNSIGIQSLGNPQADLLKNKIANFKTPTNLSLPVSAGQSNQQEEQSAFGNGSCVRKLLQESHITKHYEKYKRGYIELTKTQDKAKKEAELMKNLLKFETGIANTDQDESSNVANSIENDDGDTDDDDFEEVENADFGEDFDSYKPSCLKQGVTIEVKPVIKQRIINKNEDWIYDAIRQSINRQRKENYLNATKVDLLCNLARVKYLNELTFDPEMQTLAISLDLFDNLKTKLITDSFIKKFVDKFKSTFRFNYSKESQLISSKDAIRECFATKETAHPTVYNLIFLILYRTFCKQNSIEENSKLCLAVKPIDFKCDIALSKPKSGDKKKAATKKKAVEIENDLISDEEEEDEKPKKAKSKSAKKSTGGKSKAKSKNSKKKKLESDDESIENDDDDEDFSETETKPTKRKSKAKDNKKATKAADDCESEKKPLKIVEKSMQLNKKNLVEIWVEIYLNDKLEWSVVKKEKKQSEKKLVSTNGWYCIEPINGIITSKPEELEKKLFVNPLYVLSFNSKLHFKDLTSKYIPNFYLHKFKRLRLEDEWLSEAYSAFRPIQPTEEEEEEDEKIRQIHLDKPLPKSMADFKSHGLYVLERHLLKYEVIWPSDAPIVGNFNNDKIYLRENVHQTHSKEYWKKEARQVKKGEEPMKISTARPKWDRNAGDWIRDIPLELFHWSQTQDWDAGEVIDGKVPRNEYGNIDLFKESMLPRGASYLRLNGLLKIAQKLNIDCVPAVTGFDLKKACTVPLMDGFVVPQEYEEILTLAWNEEQERLIKNAEEKYFKRVYGNWRRLIKGVLIHLDIKRKYRGDSDDGE